MSGNVGDRSWAGDLATRAIEDTAPPITAVALRYHTIDGVEHVEGEEYEITTTVGTLSTLMACQFADFAGAPPAAITVPDVVGQTQAAATAAITGASLVVGTVSNASDPVIAAGSVIAQSPTAGTQVNAGAAVDLVVSTGP